MATLETMVQEHPVQQPAPDAAVTQTYSLSFDPAEGVFWLFEDGSPTPPPNLELVVTQNDTEIVINATSPLTFYTDDTSAYPPFTLLPVNRPGMSVTGLTTSTSSVSFTIPTAPSSSSVFGFWLNMSYGSSLINLTTPFFFITPGSISPPAGITLTYNTTTGVFSYGNAVGDLPLQKLEVFYRLGYQAEAPGTPVQVTLVSTPDTTATFANPAILWSDGTTTPRDGSNPNLVTLSCPFISGRALGMQFVVEYAEGTVNSPDPIIMDKQIGDNGQP